ncbi:tigger transposable element-derived protein [Plakobranchus ocellatus]|uniref:Tigger transposable element-derived protein n=1 Tax=Plakobranchus ocellatus TaxID=259542 RepID=A0AAV4B1I6_9GAST|nr:tigger transposable element-derived protein [Plakobranchus ocellatus]
MAQRGVEHLGAIIEQERGTCGTLVTVCCGISASGNNIPPFLIFLRVNSHDHWRLMLSPGGVIEGHPKASGWMTRLNFLSFLQNVVKDTKPSADSPVLLLLDNHQLQILTRWCHEAANTGRPRTIHRVPSIVNYGFTHAFDQETFCLGLNPLASVPSTVTINIIPDDRYLPVYTTDRPFPAPTLSEITSTAHETSLNKTSSEPGASTAAKKATSSLLQ